MFQFSQIGPMLSNVLARGLEHLRVAIKTLHLKSLHEE